jgi:uncharacterized damage-inducible protein DinB
MTTIAPLASALIEELTTEAAITRRVLERVPDAHLAWTPHAKSRTLGQLALHLAANPEGVTALTMHNPATFPGAPAEPTPGSTAEVLSTLDASLAEATRRLAAFSDAALTERWSVQMNGVEVMALPRLAFLRSVLLNHWYHHRGQLTVYLRLLDVPVPSIYGPSADENPFM